MISVYLLAAFWFLVAVVSNFITNRPIKSIPFMEIMVGVAMSYRALPIPTSEKRVFTTIKLK